MLDLSGTWLRATVKDNLLPGTVAQRDWMNNDQLRLKNEDSAGDLQCCLPIKWEEKGMADNKNQDISMIVLCDLYSLLTQAKKVR